MESTQKILLNSSNNKKDVNENMSLNIPINGNRVLLPEDAIDDSLNSYEIYLNERKNSNKFRIVLSINPYCSNVLFNPFTEIVKNEGSNNIECIYYNSNYENDNTIGKVKTFKWNQYEAIRDTQLSNEACGFVYHCGIDIFNNHILRNKTFKAVNFNENNSGKEIGNLSAAYGDSYKKVKVNNQGTPHKYISKDFNTIDDYMRDRNGWIVSEDFPKIVKTSFFNNNLETIILPLHLYQNYDALSFDECVKDKLIEQNGWYGFNNPSVFGVTTLCEGTHESTSVTYTFRTDEDNLYFCDETQKSVRVTANKETTTEKIDSTKLNIDKVINSREYHDFIDMYPGRDLYSFAPKYNEYRKRIEKNWNYCLTYPSKNVITNGDGNEFPFFEIDESGNTSLKVYMFDELVVDDDGRELVTIYTVSQHGLLEGDFVNVYKSDSIFYDSAEVVHVIDKYIFQIFKSNGNMSNSWVDVEDRDELGGVLEYEGSRYPICESNRCNVDPEAQNIHIRRVVNGVECKYYVRKFSRLPNFKFKDEEINDYTLYNDKSNELIEKFSDPSNAYCEFESHIAKLGFANTSYGDDVSEIVFTDDIDTSYLRDNLGRPLSDIYITIVKNNKGYKKWYGIGGDIDIKNESIEYSHCFGKVNGSFLLSDYFRESYTNGNISVNLYDVRDITFSSKALITETEKVSKVDGFKDEIEYYSDYEYYGDICSYSPVDCDEQVIQTAMHRFNTVQRELINIDAAVKTNNYFTETMYHDEIYDVENTMVYSKTNDGDPYSKFNYGSEHPTPKSGVSSNYLYHTTREELKDMLNFKEGYYYQPHYRIGIKTVSRELNVDNPTEYEITDFINTNSSTSDNNRNLYEIKTLINNGFCKNEKLILYKKSINKYYFVTVYSIIDFNRFTCTIEDEQGNDINSDFDNINDYTLLKKHESTPPYARIIKDGSCRYCWREVISNGIESNEKAFPFTNGAFYINKRINFFLRRQDPKKYNLGYKKRKSGMEVYDYVPDGEDIANYPNFNPIYTTNYEANEIEGC